MKSKTVGLALFARGNSSCRQKCAVQACVVSGWYGAVRALLPYTGGALERLQGTRHGVQFSLSRNAIFPPLLFLETERGIGSKKEGKKQSDTAG